MPAFLGRERYAESSGAFVGSRRAGESRRAPPHWPAWSATGQLRLVFAALLALMLAGVAGLALVSRRPSELQPPGVPARSIL